MKQRSESEWRSRYRIVTNGEHFKVQRRSWWRWSDVRDLPSDWSHEQAMLIGLGAGVLDCIPVYVTREQAETVVDELVAEAVRQQRQWRPL